MDRNVLTAIDGGIGRITLNRPDRHNAFDGQTIEELIDAFRALGDDPSARVVVLAATGKSFCAGADLNWMKQAAAQDYAENLTDARRLAEMLRSLARIGKPTVARVQGPAYGGGVGLIAACDIAIATANCQFALTEVRLGIVPAAISPHVLAAIGPRQARRYMLSAESFSAADALGMGLLHETVADEAALDATLQGILANLLKNGPRALAACKDLIAAVAGQPLSAELVEDTARRIADIRVTDEAKEGMAAFLERRKPGWMAGS